MCSMVLFTCLREILEDNVQFLLLYVCSYLLPGSVLLQAVLLWEVMTSAKEVLSGHVFPPGWKGCLLGYALRWNIIPLCWINCCIFLADVLEHLSVLSSE